MKRILLAAFLVLPLLAGCARNYTIVTRDGRQMTAMGKPKLREGFYIFKDASGQPASISAGRVQEISPASMIVSENKQFIR